MLVRSVWRCGDLCDDWVTMSLFLLEMEYAVVGVKLGGEMCDVVYGHMLGDWCGGGGG